MIRSLLIAAVTVVAHAPINRKGSMRVIGAVGLLMAAPRYSQRTPTGRRSPHRY